MPTESAVTQVAGMKSGHAYSRSLYFPFEKADPDSITRARRNLVSYLTPVVARARRQRKRNYKIHTMASFTGINYDVIVTGVIVIEPKRKQSEPLIPESTLEDDI